jgi:hypothetical protein
MPLPNNTPGVRLSTVAYFRYTAIALKKFVQKATDHTNRVLRLKVAFVYYIESIRIHHHDHPDYRWDDFQIQDAFKILERKRTCLNRCRGGSKTRDMALLAVFLAIVGYKIMWFAAYMKQLIRAQEHWVNNPYVMPFNYTSDRNTWIKLVYGHVIEIGVLSEGNVLGPRKHIIFYDEMARMATGLVDDSEGIFNGMGADIKAIYFSTPLINTVFHDHCALYLTLEHNCYEPSWFTLDNIQDAERKLPTWKFKQDFLCMFVSGEGMIFTDNLHEGAFPDPDTLQAGIYYGMDPNPREGYWVIGVQYSHPAYIVKNNRTVPAYDIAVCHAQNFGSGALGKEAALAFLKEETGRFGVHAELEANGVGEAVCDDYFAMGGKGYAMHWTDTEKSRRVHWIADCQVYFDLKNPHYTGDELKARKALWAQMNALKWNIAGTAVDKPNNVPWHAADAGMHAMMEPNPSRMTADVGSYEDLDEGDPYDDDDY